MHALVIVDAQNEFSPQGQRAVPGHAAALAAIARLAELARRDRAPIAWIRHHNRPDEGPAFRSDSWGAEFSPGMGPQQGHGPEVEFHKDVFGAFSGTDLEAWLHGVGADGVLLGGFFTHMCVSTTAREGLMRGFAVTVDADATGARDVDDGRVGRMSADEVRRSALLHLADMGARIA
jgi:nicotinamidase-related amidase